MQEQQKEAVAAQNNTIVFIPDIHIDTNDNSSPDIIAAAITEPPAAIPLMDIAGDNDVVAATVASPETLANAAGGDDCCCGGGGDDSGDCGDCGDCGCII
ncbi:hypothetical protein FBU30_001149, partial [Linnemannia zychae]